MNITADMKVSDIALADTRLREALETMGIDTCCGGQKPLRDAALAIAHPVENVVQELHKALERPLPLRAPQKDWRAVLPCELCRHIVDTPTCTALSPIFRSSWTRYARPMPSGTVPC